MPSGQSDDRAIQSFIFGGLNTNESPLNLPYGDSPLLWNVNVDENGSLRKRKGSLVLKHYTSQKPGVALVPFATGLNYNFLVSKQGTDLVVHHVKDDVLTDVVTKANVFPSSVSGVRASTVQTGDVDTKIIFLTGARPVQLTFTEVQHVFTASVATSVVVPRASKLAYASASSLIVFVNRELQGSYSASYNATTKELTLSGLPAMNGVTTVDVIHSSWQWWAESLRYFGSKFFQSTNRYNVNKSDQVVPVPADLRDDLDLPTATNPHYPIVAMKTTNYGDYYTLSTNKQPQTDVQYYHGDGARYDYAATNFVSPSPLFLTFGTKTVATDPTPTHISRRRELRFNNDSGINGEHLKVYVNGILQAPNYGVTASTFYQDYYLYNLDQTLLTAGAQTARYVSFEAARPVGIPFNAVVELVNTEPLYVGSGALTTNESYRDGAWVPVYGMGQWADTFRGYFPTVGSVFQGRLVLAGIPHKPLTVVFSSTYDENSPGKYHSFFQINEDSTKDADPFDIVIGSTPNDKVISLVEWQRTLFVLTRTAVFRVYGDEGVLTPDSRNTNYVSSIGAINPDGVVRTEFGVMYLSDSGIYDIVPTVENGEYTVRERTAKIRNQLTVLSDPTKHSLPWMTYDSRTRYVYLGVPDPSNTDTTYYLYVYNTRTDSWTEYNTPTGFQAYAGVTYIDRDKGSSVLLSCVTKRSSGTPTNMVLLRMGYDRRSDFTERYVATTTGSVSYTTVFAQPIVTHTTVAGLREYATTFNETQQYTGFRALPITTVEDMMVKLNGATLVFGTDINAPGAQWIKLPNGRIYLINDPGAGATLSIALNYTDMDLHEGVY